MTKDISLIESKTREFKADLKRYFPHKKIAEYTRLMDALEEFEEYALVPTKKPEKRAVHD